MDATTLLASSVVAAVVAGLFTLLTQRRLLERQAQIDYELPARRRLYDAIGPLRLQFVFSARDVVRRVAAHPGTQWNMDPSGYYVSSFICRLLRPLAIAQLIERQMAIADFSVDPASLELLRFKAAMEEMLTGGEVLLNHPSADWSTQSQHLFGDNLRVAAAKLLVEDEERTERVMEFARFTREFPEPLSEPALADLARIFAECTWSLLENPIFWLRVVGYAHVCHRLVGTQGAQLGFQDRPYRVDELLSGVSDEHISSRVPAYSAAFESIVTESL